MNKEYVEIAKAYKENGFTCIPVDTLKNPTINWTQYQKKPMEDKDIEKYLSRSYGIAVLTGGPGMLECVDIDLKYDLSGSLFDRLKDKVPTEILEKVFVQRTKSGGYHFIYKTNVVEPNQKLASRETTSYEKHKTYMDAFEDSSTREIAHNIMYNDKSKVLIETRGGSINKEGEKVSRGYFVVNPTPGYEYVYGKINMLSDKERNTLISCCREFNEYLTKVKNYKKSSYKGDSNPFQEYFKTGDALSVLYKNGWKEVRDTGNTIRLLRPGKPDSKDSAIWNKKERVFSVFSSSTGFEVGKGYTPTDIFIELECDGDTELAFKKLKELGYGLS